MLDCLKFIDSQKLYREALLPLVMFFFFMKFYLNINVGFEDQLTFSASNKHNPDSNSRVGNAKITA